MLEQFNLNDLRAFCVIAESGSFTAAAEGLKTSKSHLSRQLNQLEAQLGLKLIIRTTRSQRLTETGQTLLKQLQQSFEQMDRALVDCQREQEQMQGLIRINCVGGFIGESMLAPMLSRFQQQYPLIELELDFSSQREDLIAKPFDLVVRMGELSDSQLIGRHLLDIDIATLASPDYLASNAKPANIHALKQHNCLTGSVSHWRFNTQIDQQHHTEIRVTGNLSCKNGKALLNAALAGNGIVRLPTLYCQNEIEQGKLVSLFPAWQTPSVPLYLLYHQNPFQAQRLKQLIQFICQAFEQFQRPDK